MARTLVTALTIVAVAVFAAGCGSSSSSTSNGVSTAKVAPTAYVSALCKAVAPFEKDVASRSGALSSSSSTTATQGKKELVSYLGALSTDADAAVAKLRGAGVPQVGGGAAYAKTILTTFTRLDTAMSRAKQLATTLSTATTSAFQSGATKLATAVKDSVSDLGKGLNSQSNKTLDADANKQPACHAL